MSVRTYLSAAALLTAAGLFTATTNADTFKVDPVHSSVIFRVKHMQATNFWGRMEGPAGTFALDESDPAKSSLDLTVKVDTLTTQNARRDADLKSPDYFGAKQFPTITFKSSKFEKKSDNSWEVTGDLTLHGVTKSITVTLEKTGDGKLPNGAPISGFQTEFDIKRTDFGMNHMVGPVGDDVHLIIALEADKQS